MGWLIGLSRCAVGGDGGHLCRGLSSLWGRRGLHGEDGSMKGETGGRLSKASARRQRHLRKRVMGIWTVWCGLDDRGSARDGRRQRVTVMGCVEQLVGVGRCAGCGCLWVRKEQ
jgi:hypothetical protein